MERIQGQHLPMAWKTLSDAGRDSVLTQLRDMITELRAITPPPGTGVGSCVGGSLRDPRNPARSNPRFGPFTTIQDFHSWLREHLRPEEHPDRQDDQNWKDIKEMVAKQDGPWSPPVFTHGDLNPFNIMIRDKKVVAIIDWETAGWYPSYWEYTAAWTGNDVIRKGWQDLIPKFLDPYPRSLAWKSRARSGGENIKRSDTRAA